MRERERQRERQRETLGWINIINPWLIYIFIGCEETYDKIHSLAKAPYHRDEESLLGIIPCGSMHAWDYWL